MFADGNEIMWPLWQMSAESRWRVAFERKRREKKREREKERERKSACVHNTILRPIYKARARRIRSGWSPGIRAAGWAPLRPHKWMSVGEHVTGEARARRFEPPYPTPPPTFYSTASPLFSSRAFPPPRNTNDSWLRVIQTVLRQNWS